MLGALSGALACGDVADDEPIPGPGRVDDAGERTPDSAGDSTGGPDAGDGSAPGQDISEDGGEPGADDSSQRGLCGAQELGQIGADERVIAFGDFSDAADDMKLICGAEGARELVFSFSLAEPSVVELTPLSAASGAWRVQVEEGACEAAERVVCFDRGGDTFLAEAQTDYFVIVEGASDLEEGSLELTIETQALACLPGEEPACEGDELVSCGGNYQQRRHRCEFGCAEGGCRGDSCEAPLRFEPDEGQQMRIEGELEGYTNSVEMSAWPECYDEGPNFKTPGRDIFVSFEGLKAGETLRVDADEIPHDTMIFLMESCSEAGAPSCVSGQHTRNFEWEVAEDGDYILLIDMISAVSGEFNYQLSVE